MSQTSFSLYLHNQWTDFHKLSYTRKPQMKAIHICVGCAKVTTNNWDIRPSVAVKASSANISWTAEWIHMIELVLESAHQSIYNDIWCVSVTIDTFRIQQGDGLRVWQHKQLYHSKSQSAPHVVGADTSLSLCCFLMFYDILDSWLLYCYNMFTCIYSIDTILYPYTLPLQSIPLSTLKSLPKCNLSFSLRS